MDNRRKAESETMTREETVQEIKRIKQALRVTKSETLKRDYGKRLRTLQNRLLYRAD